MLNQSVPWPPPYVDVIQARIERLQGIIKQGVQKHAWHYYEQNPIDFIEHWVITYDPRNAKQHSAKPTIMPFILFPRQKALVQFIFGCMADDKNGIVEKSRDMGATWLCCAISVWLWLFKTGVSVGWGSRKQILVDRLGDADSIFEKIRMIIENLPHFLIPPGFSDKDHLNHMRCLNPANGSTITGEAGDNIGRGGRKLLYFKDESAHYERAEKIEAALTDNTNVQIDISSVNGIGNLFYTKRHGGRANVFILDWRDHPAKDERWYESRRKDAEAKGLMHLFAQEVDRDYTASVEDVFIPMKYITAAIDAHKKVPFNARGERRLGFDPHDTGKDRHALVIRQGGVIEHIEQWGDGEPDEATAKAFDRAIEYHIDSFVYDNIGIGAAVKVTLKPLINNFKESADKIISTWAKKLSVIGWNAGSRDIAHKKLSYKGAMKSEDMFINAKAQGWWCLRDRFVATYNAINGVRQDDINLDTDLISIPSDSPLANELINELSRPKRCYDSAGRIKVESKLDLNRRGIPSHNLADALVMCYVPLKSPYKIRSVF